MLASYMATLLIALVAIITPSSADFIGEGPDHSDNDWLNHGQLPKGPGPWMEPGEPQEGYVPVYPPTTLPQEPYEGVEPKPPKGSKYAPTPKNARKPWPKPPKGFKPAPTPKKARKPWFKLPKGFKPPPHPFFN